MLCTNEPGQLLVFFAVFYGAVSCWYSSLQHVGAQRLTGGRGGASRRLRAGQCFALLLGEAALRAAYLKGRLQRPLILWALFEIVLQTTV